MTHVVCTWEAEFDLTLSAHGNFCVKSQNFLENKRFFSNTGQILHKMEILARKPWLGRENPTFNSNFP